MTRATGARCAWLQTMVAARSTRRPSAIASATNRRRLPPAAALAHRARRMRIGQDPIERAGDRLRVVRDDAAAADGRDLVPCAAVGDDDRNAGGERFRNAETEALGVGTLDEHAAGGDERP